MGRIIIILFILFSPVAISSDVLSSPIVYDKEPERIIGGFDIRVKSGNGDESLVGSILISDPSEIDKKSTSPIYSIKVEMVHDNEKIAYFYIDFSTKNSREVNGKVFDTYFFIREVIEVSKSTGSRFNVGSNVILFSPI